MKTLALVLALIGLTIALPAAAQDANVITLDDASPAINVMVSLPDNATGTIALNMVSAAITVTDGLGNTVFHAADARLHAVQLNIAPNSGTHTVTVERLPGMAQAQVSIESLPELAQIAATSLVSSRDLGLNQETMLNLDAATPGGTTTVHIPQGTTGLVSATFPHASASSQLVDANGVVLAESAGGHIDGVNYVVDAGDYHVTVLGNGLVNTVVAGVSVASATDNHFTVLEAPAAVDQMVSGTEACTATVNVSSINLRSGPGTGYSVMDYGYRDEVFQVGGRNPENSWIVIGTDTGSAWMSLVGANLSGACDTLAVYNIPYRDAQPAQIVVVPVQQPVQTVQSFPQPSFHENEHDEHGEHDD